MLRPISTYLIITLAMLLSFAGQASPSDSVVADCAAAPLVHSPSSVSVATVTVRTGIQAHAATVGPAEHLTEIIEPKKREDDSEASDLERLSTQLTANFSLHALIGFIGQAQPRPRTQGALCELTGPERLIRFQVFRI